YAVDLHRGADGIARRPARQRCSPPLQATARVARAAGSPGGSGAALAGSLGGHPLARPLGAAAVRPELPAPRGPRPRARRPLGRSHYREHMLFKGTPTRPPGSIDILIEGLGGSSNAFTSYDYTHYDVVVPARALRPAVELLADIGVNANFPPAEIDSEKAVVFEEMRLTEDDPEKFAARRLGELAYSPHPYGRPS